MPDFFSDKYTFAQTDGRHKQSSSEKEKTLRKFIHLNIKTRPPVT